MAEQSPSSVSSKVAKEIFERATDAASDYSDLIETVPYAKHLLAGYRWARRQRVMLFLRSLDVAAEQLSEEQRQRFHQIISSDDGRELLAEYTDTVLRTSSRTAIAALAILYADTDDGMYPQEFKVIASLALEGITENLVDFFLSLTSNADAEGLQNKKDGPYPVYFIKSEPTRNRPELNDLQPAFAGKVAATESLVRRGMILPDYTSRIGGGGGSYPFGIGDTTLRFRRLLTKARSCVEASAP